MLLTTGIFPPDIGGPATYVPRIAKGLQDMGHTVKVLTTSEPEHMTYDDSPHPFPVVRMARRVALWYRPLYYIWKILRHGHSADMIYANGIYKESVLAALLLRKPLIIKIVGDDAWERSTSRGWSTASFEAFQHQRQSLVVEIFRALHTWAVRRAWRVIVPSAYLKRIVMGWGVPEERCVVVYNAIVDETSGSEGQQKPANVSLPSTFTSMTRLMTVGRLIPMRNVDLILQAVARLPHTTLTVVGDGPSRTGWEAEAERLGISERVWFAGKQPTTVVRALLRQHDMYVLASSYEGLPHSVLEAMQADIPVVTTSAGGTPELVHDDVNGLLVPPNDADALFAAIQRVVDDDTMRERLRQNAHTTLTRFTYQHMLTETEKVLRYTAQPYTKTTARA
jgi:glycosyltransferase involved in cell wall biosynthesis